MNFKDMNDVKIMGRLTADAEQKTVNENSTVTSFTIACDRNVPREGEEKKTDFLRVESWNLSATFVQKYLLKGKLIVVDGSLRNNNWEDVDGNKHYTTYIEADKIYITQYEK